MHTEYLSLLSVQSVWGHSVHFQFLTTLNLLLGEKFPNVTSPKRFFFLTLAKQYEDIGSQEVIQAGFKKYIYIALFTMEIK